MRFATLTIMLAACGSSGDNSQTDAAAHADTAIDSPSDPALRYEPWKVGAVWSYRLTDPNGVLPPAMDKRTTVVDQRDVGGVHAGQLAFFVHAEQLKGSKDVYEAIAGELDVRYQSTFYDANGLMTGTDVDQPYRLKLDESAAHTKAGAQWSEMFVETTSTGSTTKTESWQVVSATEPVTVLAGSYTCLHVRRTSNGGTVQDYWYARGVGKVKETGGGQDEELMSFTPGA